MDRLFSVQPVPDHQCRQRHIEALGNHRQIIAFFDHVDPFLIFSHPLLNKFFEPGVKSVGRAFGD